MKVIFLDIDGVLNVMPDDRDEFGPTFHSNFVDNLNYIIESTGAKIVISSSWRADGIKKLQSMWEHRNLPGEIIGVTTNCHQMVDDGKFEFYDMVERGHEIQEWIDEHPEISSWVIIDDDNDMLSSQRDRFIRTSNLKDEDCVEGYGLVRRLSEMTISILNG